MMDDLNWQLIKMDQKAQARTTRTIIVTNSEGYQAYWATLESQQRFMYKDLVEWGHINLMINSTPIVTKSDAAPGYHLCDWPLRKADPIIYPKAPVPEQAVAV